jgi:hypothetical protein
MVVAPGILRFCSSDFCVDELIFYDVGVLAASSLDSKWRRSERGNT